MQQLHRYRGTAILKGDGEQKIAGMNELALLFSYLGKGFTAELFSDKNGPAYRISFFGMQEYPENIEETLRTQYGTCWQINAAKTDETKSIPERETSTSEFVPVDPGELLIL